MRPVVFGADDLADALQATAAPAPDDEARLDATWDALDAPCLAVVVVSAERSTAEPTDALLAALLPTFLVARRLAEEWVLGGGGALVVACPRPADDDVLGRATVGALTAFVRSLTREYGGRGARANLVVFGRAARLAPTVCFLLSPRASFVSGEVVHLAPEATPCGSASTI